MKELVLHQTGQRAKLGEESTEETQFVHVPERFADLPLAGEDRNEGFLHRRLVDVGAVHHVLPSAEAQFQFGAQLGIVLLRKEKDADEP